MASTRTCTRWPTRWRPVSADGAADLKYCKAKVSVSKPSSDDNRAQGFLLTKTGASLLTVDGHLCRAIMCEA